MIKKFITSMIMALVLVACGQSTEQPVDTENIIEANSDTTTNKNLEVDVAEKVADENEEIPNDASLADLKIHYIDAGQADATLFQYTYEDKSYTILYDTGDWNKNDVVNYLESQNVSFIDLIIVSHPHADHTGQLADIINTYETGEVWLSGNTASSQTFQQGLDAVLASDADYYEPRTGDIFDIGSLKIEVLHPGSISGKLNEESISLMFTYGEKKFLFTGDAGKKEEIQMINGEINVQADILHLGHHGSKTSSDPAFITAVNPAVAIYSAGTNNSYGHPHAEVVSLIQNDGITLYGTDVHGTILVTTDGTEYTIETKEDGTITPESTGTSSTTAEPKESNTEEKPINNNCVDINQASIDEVQEIIHIGPARAQELIDSRPYESVDNLSSINGIGPARIADIKDQGLACVK